MFSLAVLSNFARGVDGVLSIRQFHCEFQVLRLGEIRSSESARRFSK